MIVHHTLVLRRVAYCNTSITRFAIHRPTRPGPLVHKVTIAPWCTSEWCHITQHSYASAQCPLPSVPEHSVARTVKQIYGTIPLPSVDRALANKRFATSNEVQQILSLWCALSGLLLLHPQHCRRLRREYVIVRTQWSNWLLVKTGWWFYPIGDGRAERLHEECSDVLDAPI